jgi:hypothetical protein
MYYSTSPSPSLNKKDLDNQEKTRTGFLLNEVDMSPVQDPQITVATKEHDDMAIIKEPTK